MVGILFLRISHWTDDCFRERNGLFSATRYLILVQRYSLLPWLLVTILPVEFSDVNKGLALEATDGSAFLLSQIDV